MEILFSAQVAARDENLGRLISSVSDCARLHGFAQERIGAIRLAVEEALVNIFRYAYPQGAGEVQVNCGLDRDRFIVEIMDSGIPFDMTTLPDPDVFTDLSTRKEGGLGVFLIKKMVDEVRYRREDDRNILHLIFKRATDSCREP